MAYDMKVQGLPDIPNQAEFDSDPKRLKLKQACSEFEAVMFSLVMKEGLKGAEELGKVPGSETDEDSGTKTFKEMAYEQMFYHVGKTGMLGLGKMLYDSLKDRVQETEK